MPNIKKQIASELRRLDKILAGMYKTNTREFRLGQKAQKRVKNIKVLNSK